MPTFDSPGPVAVSIELGAGDVRVVASDRHDTTVEVRPSDAGKPGDVAAAKATVVDYTGGTLSIRAPRRRLWYTLAGPGRESVDVEVAVPVGSALRVEAGFGAIRCAGALGDCDLKSGGGEIVVEEAGALNARTGIGNITAEVARRQAEAKTGTGEVRIGKVQGPATIRNSNGGTWLGEVSGDVDVRAANGRISIERAGSSVAARTACGDIFLGEVGSGTVAASTSWGRVEVGVRPGAVAWLDLQTRAGKLVNELDSSAPPSADEGAVHLVARTSAGDITVRRA
jgi:DUF4097 and DUF4098 domain-containing protein YvlB